MTREVRELGHIPEHIAKCVGWEALAWHTAEWWRAHWALTGLVEVTAARSQPSGWSDWLLWSKVCHEHSTQPQFDVGTVIEMLEADGGELLSFALVTARKNV